MSRSQLGSTICHTVLNLFDNSQAMCIESISPDCDLDKAWSSLYQYVIYKDYDDLPGFLNSVYGTKASAVKRSCLADYTRHYYGSLYDNHHSDVQQGVDRLTLTDLDLILVATCKERDWVKLCSVLRLPKINKRTKIGDDLCRYSDCKKLPDEIHRHVECKCKNNKTLKHITKCALETANEPYEKRGALRLCALILYGQLITEGMYYDKSLFEYHYDDILEYSHDDSFRDHDIYCQLPKLPGKISYKRDFAYSCMRRRYKNNFLRHIEWNILHISHLPHHSLLMMMDQYQIPTEHDLAFVPHNDFENLLQEDICHVLMDQVTNDYHKKELMRICQKDRNVVHAILASSYHDGKVDMDIVASELAARH